MKKTIVIILFTSFCIFSSCKKATVGSTKQTPETNTVMSPAPIPCLLGNCWTLKNPFPGTSINFMEGTFTINNKTYMATYSNHPEPLWIYDGTSWSQGPALSPPILYCSTVFSIGSKGYAVFSDLVTTIKSLYSFDPSTNLWTQLADFPGFALGGGTRKAFSIGNKGYTITFEPAASGTGYRYVLWEYDAGLNTWTAKSNLPKPTGIDISPDVAFSIGNKAYMILGDIQAAPSVGLFYEYNPATNTWTSLPNMPGVRKYSATSFVVGTAGFVGTGKTAGGIATSEFYRFLPATNTWLKVKDYPGGGTFMALGFSMNSRGYVLDFHNPNIQSGTNLFYLYTPGVIQINP